MVRPLILLLVGVLCAPVSAKVYKLVLPDGSVQFTDQPQEGAEEVKLPPVQTFRPPPVPPSGSGSSGERGDAGPLYESIAVVSPRPDETLRDNTGTVDITLSLEPSLRAGHTVEILLDGKAIGSGAGTSVSVSDVDRGTHTVSAAVKDADGNTLATAPGVTFHLKRTAVGGPRAAPLPRGGAGAGRGAGGS
jgi:hypothetical protein